jgi:hypothetical protein
VQTQCYFQDVSIQFVPFETSLDMCDTTLTDRRHASKSSDLNWRKRRSCSPPTPTGGFIMTFCLRPDSEAVAEGLGRHIWPPPSPPSTHFTEFQEKCKWHIPWMSCIDMNNMNWHEWHELTWMTWIDINDMNWHKWHELTWMTWIDMNYMNWHECHKFTRITWFDMNDMNFHEWHEMTWHYMT